MTSNSPQVPWTEEQWALVTQTVQKEASRARVAASFLPLYGPLPPDTDFVRKEALNYNPKAPTKDRQRMVVDDKSTVPLASASRPNPSARRPLQYKRRGGSGGNESGDLTIKS